MPNLLIKNSGALGDNAYCVPALNVLRKQYEKIYMWGTFACEMALGDTGLIDDFIILPGDFKEWDFNRARAWNKDVLDYKGWHIDEIRDVGGAVASKFMFHPEDPKADSPVEWRRSLNKGVNYFDEMSMTLGVPEAIGQRPVTPITHAERSWLRDFKHIHSIPKGTFILGYQLQGSAWFKRYPYFAEVIQRNIMQEYPDVYVVMLGDMKGKIDWKRRYHHGRFINLKDTVSFRMAYLLTSTFDLFISPETGVFCFSQAFPDVPKILLATHTTGEHIVCEGDNTTIIASEAKCAPCYIVVRECTYDGTNPWQLCAGRIPPKKVIAAIKDVIERE